LVLYLPLTSYAHKRIISNMKDVIGVLCALAEPTRLAALRIIWDGRERCVCELMRELGASQSRMSRHMNVLKIAGLVTGGRDAQRVRYRRAPGLSAEVVALVEAALALAPVNAPGSIPERMPA
jgi:ArsR family transcriptional regulator, arsenate/arsenite/antimonite-responsive transcriptional repressor